MLSEIISTSVKSVPKYLKVQLISLSKGNWYSLVDTDEILFNLEIPEDKQLDVIKAVIGVLEGR